MDVRKVHGALWRELEEPMELFRRTPWYIKHTFLLLFWVAIIYLFMQSFDWNEYEEDPLRRYLREARLEEVSDAPTTATPVSP